MYRNCVPNVSKFVLKFCLTQEMLRKNMMLCQICFSGVVLWICHNTYPDTEWILLDTRWDHISRCAWYAPPPVFTKQTICNDYSVLNADASSKPHLLMGRDQHLRMYCGECGCLYLLNGFKLSIHIYDLVMRGWGEWQMHFIHISQHEMPPQKLFRLSGFNVHVAFYHLIAYAATRIINLENDNTSIRLACIYQIM